MTCRPGEIAIPLDAFIITVFCWMEKAFAEVTDGVRLRTQDFAPP